MEDFLSISMLQYNCFELWVLDLNLAYEKITFFENISQVTVYPTRNQKEKQISQKLLPKQEFLISESIP